MVSFSPEQISPEQIYDMLEKDSAGSVLLHFAVAKASEVAGGTTSHISYVANGDVEKDLRLIAAEMREKWNLTDALLLRRQGMVAVGEIISLVAVSSPGSEAAFAACQLALDRMKKMRSVIKKEITG